MSEMETFDVAVTVFATACGVDERDANGAVVLAVQRLLRDHGPLVDPVYGSEIPVYRVMSTGAAAANGYLWLGPTSRARGERAW